MELHDPVAAYNAASNVEAHLVCNLLVDAGIEAMVVEDVSQVGVWIGGLVPEIHKPQVWIARADVERAGTVLSDHAQRQFERQNAQTGESIEVSCEECATLSWFPHSEKGSVQSCPHCGAYVDVGESSDFDDWASTDEDTDLTPDSP